METEETKQMRLIELIKSKNAKTDSWSKYKSASKHSRITASEVVSSHCEPFDIMGTAKKMVEKYHDDPKSTYYQMTLEQILEMWEEKKNLGLSRGKNLDKVAMMFQNKFDETQSITESLNYIDSVSKEHMFEDEISNVKARLFSMYAQYLFGDKGNRDINNFFEVVDMCSEQTLFGTINDVIYQGRFDQCFTIKSKISGEIFYLIVDYKNDEELTTTNQWRKMLGAMNEYDDSKLNRYTLQLSFYKYLLSNFYGIDPDKIRMCISNITSTNFEIFQPSFQYNKEFMDKVLEYAVVSKRTKLAKES